MTDKKQIEKQEKEKPLNYTKESYETLKRLYDEFNQARLLEYIALVQSPKKLFWLNFLSGMAKGLGLTIGTAIVLMILFKIAQHIISLNIPYITVWITEWISEITHLMRSTH